MSNKYTGFWNPQRNYLVGDIVTYYDDAGYNLTCFYECISDVSSVKNNLGYSGCPLKNFQMPVLSGGITPEVIDPSYWNPTEGHKLVEITAQLMSETSDWTTYQWYHPTHWTGPNGSNLEVQTAFWVKRTLTPSQSSISQASVDNQRFTATSRTTTSVGLYNTETTEEIPFDNISDSPEGGELEADNYYISSVQNYKGYWNKANDYKKFDIVRHRESNSFYYAKKDIRNFNDQTDRTFNCECYPPDVPLVENHVGTLIYRSVTGFTHANDGTPLVNAFAVGQTVQIQRSNQVILGTFSIAKLTNSVMVLAHYSTSGEYYHQITKEDLMPVISTPESLRILVKVVEDPDVDPFLDNTFEANWTKDYFIFDPDYGSSVTFSSENTENAYGDGYKAHRPKGPNSLKATFDLNFTNRSSREANAILHFIENKLGQHEDSGSREYTLDYNQGIEGFYLDGATLFFPYLNTENLVRKFYCFQFDHTIETEDVHNINLSIFNNSTSILNRNDYMYVNRPDVYDEDRVYRKNDVVYVEENDGYYYHIGEASSRGDPPISTHFITGKITSINQNIWTREFHWFPSTTFTVQHNPDIIEISGNNSAYTQYLPGNKVNINVLKFTLKFENRSAEEAYAIIHFLESHLGYKSFLYTPPAPYNRKRRFICPEWTHTYAFKDSHTVSAKFEQFTIGQNTPLDDDEIDGLNVAAEKDEARLVFNTEIDLRSSQTPPSGQTFKLRNIIEIENIGEKAAENITTTITDDASNKFSKSIIGEYATSAGGLQSLTSVENYNNSETGVFIYITGGTVFAQDNLGRISQIDSNNGTLKSRSNPMGHQSLHLLQGKTNLNPGEKIYIEVSANASDSEQNEAYTAKLNLQYNTEGSTELQTNSAEINAHIAYEKSKEETIDIDINGTELTGDIYIKKYSADLFAEVHAVDPTNQIDNFKASAMRESGKLAEPQSQEELDAILLDNGVEGILVLGVIFHAGGWRYASDLSAFTLAGISGSDGDILAIKTGDNAREMDSFVAISNDDAATIDAIIIENTGVNSLANINLKSILVEEANAQGLTLSNIKTINFNIYGVIFSDSTDQPAITSGSGFLAHQDVNINIKENAFVIGKGGRGGDGMFSEGKIDENDGSKTSIPYLTPPQSGDKGGDALEISETNVLVNFVVNLPTNGGVFGGGGGGAGGNVNQDQYFDWPISVSSFIDFGGGGGGGAGMGESGNIMGISGNINSGGDGGAAKTHSLLYEMKPGASGGGPGEDGSDNDQSKMFAVSGGKAGFALIYYSGNLTINNQSATNLKGGSKIK